VAAICEAEHLFAIEQELKLALLLFLHRCMYCPVWLAVLSCVMCQADQSVAVGALGGRGDTAALGGRPLAPIPPLKRQGVIADS
jgi:hypothetical protein